MKRLLVMAGGTGGHIFPALAVAAEMSKAGVVVEWLGTPAGMETKLVAEHYPLHLISVKTFRGKGILAKAQAPFRLIHALMSAIKVMHRVKPDVVLGMGGYVTGPGGIAAWLLRKPLIIHEQNAIAGLTNRWLMPFSTKVLEAFPAAFSKSNKVITVGNPIRATIQPKPYITHEPLRVLILGGSQGARFINQLLMDFVRAQKKPKDFLIWHQTGSHDFENVKKVYAGIEDFPHRVMPFIDRMEDAYLWADVVVARSGALTVSELSAVGLPSILIPFPFAADDHQYYNAQFLVKQKAAVVLREEVCSVNQLQEQLLQLTVAPAQLEKMAKNARKAMKQDATEVITRILLSYFGMPIARKKVPKR